MIHFHACSILMRTLCPGESSCIGRQRGFFGIIRKKLTSAFRLPSTESGVPVRA